jgi:hypothetical protein
MLPLIGIQPNRNTAYLIYNQRKYLAFVPCIISGDAAAGLDLIPSLADGSVDLISAAMVFHHVTNIFKVLLELRRLISPR